jgi:hypothetical protein
VIAVPRNDKTVHLEPRSLSAAVLSDICERCEVGAVAGYALAEPGATLMFIALCEKCLDIIEDDWKTGAQKIAEWQNRAQG